MEILLNTHVTSKRNHIESLNTLQAKQDDSSLIRQTAQELPLQEMITNCNNKRANDTDETNTENTSLHISDERGPISMLQGICANHTSVRHS